MSPANDASRHGALLSFGSVWRVPGRGREAGEKRDTWADPTLTCRILDAFFDHEQRACGHLRGNLGASRFCLDPTSAWIDSLGQWSFPRPAKRSDPEP
jgi:hypothetical protein